MKRVPGSWLVLFQQRKDYIFINIFSELIKTLKEIEKKAKIHLFEYKKLADDEILREPVEGPVRRRGDPGDQRHQPRHQSRH